MLKRITSLIALMALIVCSVNVIAYDKTDVKFYLDEKFDSFKTSWNTEGESVALSLVPGGTNGDRSLKKCRR